MRRRTLSSTSVVRSYNVAAVLQRLHRAGSCSRSELTELTRMSPSTVSRITAQLIKRGIIVEERSAPPPADVHRSCCGWTTKSCTSSAFD